VTRRVSDEVAATGRIETRCKMNEIARCRSGPPSPWDRFWGALARPRSPSPATRARRSRARAAERSEPLLLLLICTRARGKTRRDFGLVGKCARADLEAFSV
jgi:hypothetical protein